MKTHLSIAAGLAALLTAGLAQAATLPFLTFEGDEFVGDSEAQNPLAGTASTAGLGGGFGVTEGTRAFVINNAPASQNPVFATTVGGADTGESLANYNSFRSVVTALQSGQTATFSFDFSYDFTNTATAGGFYQPGLVFNTSGTSFQQNLAFGGLLGGNVRSFGDFPLIGPAAQSGGATLTILDPINYTTDLRGSLRMTIPVGLAGSGRPILLGVDAGDVNNSFYQFIFNTNGGFGGTANYAFDNFVFNTAAVPEPTTLATLAIAGVAALGRRRRAAR